MTTEHQPGSQVDIAEFEAHGGSWSRNRLLDTAVLAVTELRTLRARVGELESKLRGAVHAVQDAVEANERLTARAESAEARVKELEAQGAWEGVYKGEHRLRREAESRITALESQLAAARSNSAQLSEELRAVGEELARLREEAGFEQAVREALGGRIVTLVISVIEDDCRQFFAEWALQDGDDIGLSNPTLPALLRAILEVEKGGPGEG